MKKSRNGMRITGLLLTMVMLVALLGAFSMTASAAAAEDISVTIDTGASITLKDTDGDGAYEIGNADELYAFAAAVNGGSYSINGELTANIVVNEGVLDEMAKAEPDTARFREWMPIGYYYILDDVEYDVYFLGTFDGNGKTVNGLYVNDTDKYSVGLFGQIGEGATVETVGVIDSYFCGNEFIGGVVGYNEFGTVTNCYNMGNVSGKLNVGGVIGANNYGNVTNCYNTGVVNGTEWIGGAVGYNYGTVEKCYNIGGVSGMSKVGGVLGGNDKLVTSCYYLAGTANGGIDSADISGQAEVKDDTWFAEYPICRVVGFGHEWADGSCTACGYVCIHDGEVTPATCQKQAVCETCGESYGELAEDNHNFDEFNTCVCGVKNFHIYGQQLNVGGDLSMKYYVTAFGDGVSTDTLKMKFIFLGRETVVSGIYNAEMGMYVFTLEGINPQCMGDKIDAYLLLNGEEKASKLSYTVEENLLALRKEYEDDESLVTLVNDILAYGTAASEYKDHNSMTDVYVGSDREIPETEWPTLDNGFEGYTVVFGQVNYLKIKVNLAEGQTLYLDGVNVTAKVVDGIFKTDGIAPTNFDKKFNFEIRTDGVLFNTFSVSVDDYLSAKRESETMGKLVKALYNYGVSAEIYNHIKTGNGEHIYAYTDNGDGTHSKVCACGNNISSEAHTAVNHICTDCGAMEIVVSFDAGDYEWKTGDTLYFCRVSHDNEWEEYCFTATVAEDGTVTWTPDKPLYWDGTGEHSLIVSYPANMGLGWDDFAIPSDQSTTELLRGADHMNARWAGTPTTNVINFELKHRMAKITVKYVLASQFDGMEDVTAEIYSNAKYCIFSDADGLPIITSVGQYDAWITPYYAEQDIVGYHYFTVYVTPGEYNMYDSLKFYADGVLQSIDIWSDDGELENMTFEEGGEYTFEVKVGKDKVLVLTEHITITDYPGGWNSDSEESLNGEIAIGTPDDGKTGWAVGDQVFVTLHSDYFGAQTYVYTFDGNGWTFEYDCFYHLEDEVPTVTAIYAPCYEYDWWDKPLVLTDGMMLGMTEYLEAYCEMDNWYSINVDFWNAIHNYSRLRIVGQANTTYTVTVTDFTPAGTTETGTHTYTLTTDKDGNAYLYGTFAEDATVTVEKGEITLTEYTFTAEKNPNGPEHHKSYVLEARAVIDGTLGGKAEATEEDVRTLVNQLKAYLDNGITTIIVTGENPAMIDMGYYTNTAIGEAIYRLSGSDYYDENNPYNGKIDLILQDVTEIVDQEFYSAWVLNSITLPKVIKMGDEAFHGTWLLKTITFGSVLTEANEADGVMFAQVGKEVGGCDLILNCGQMNESSVPAPDLTANTWKFKFVNEFKSITLTHTGECDECKANQ